jgi:hypothetical protein
MSVHPVRPQPRALTPPRSGMSLTQVLDEPARERLVLVAGVRRASVFRQLVMALAVGGVVLAGFLSDLRRGREDVQLGVAFAAAIYLLLIGLWLWRKLSRKDRVVTLTRGRIEVVEGESKQSWSARDLRYLEQTYSLHQTKHLTLHTVRLWLVVDEKQRVELLRYEQESWGQQDAERYAGVERALARLGLRERLPVPASEEGTPADVTPDPAPRFGVEWNALEPALRDVLVEAQRLPPGVRLLADRSEGDAGTYVLGLVVALFFALPLVGGAVAAWLQNPEAWKVPDDAVNFVAMLFIYALLGGLAFTPVYFGWQVRARRRVDARIRAGQHAQGLYLLPDVLLESRAGRVTVMPRARVLRLSRVRGGGLALEYRSAEHLREWLHLAGRYPYDVREGNPFKVLETWRTAGSADAPAPPESRATR